MILDVSGLAAQQMRLARELDAALRDERRTSSDRAVRIAAGRKVAELRHLHWAALKAYNRACDEAAADLRRPPPDDQPTLWES